MSYRDFYKISKFLNETDEIEIACLTYEYKKEYDLSIVYGYVTLNLLRLCTELIYDMDFADYLDTVNNLTIEEMEEFLHKTLDELS